MSIAVQCPGCRQPYNLNERLAGQTVKCKKCGGPIAVQATRGPSAAAGADWLLNESHPLQTSLNSATPAPTIPRLKPKKQGGIPPIVTRVAGVCTVAVLAISTAYLRHVRRVERREATARQAAGLPAPQILPAPHLSREKEASPALQVPQPTPTMPAPVVPATAAPEAKPLAGTLSPETAAPSQTVSVFIQNIPAGLGSVVTERLGKLAGASEMKANSMRDDETTVTLSPVPDIRALAEKIDFGTVTEIDDRGRRLVIRADASKLPPPLEPEVANPLAADFYRQNLADLSSPDKGRRKRAVERLIAARPNELKAEIAAALLKQLSESEDYFTRRKLVETMPAWATADEAVPKLIALLGDKEMADLAIKSLGQLRDVRAVEPLLGVVERHGFQVEDAIKQIGSPAEPILLEHIDEPNENVRKLVIRALGHVGTEKSEPVLQKLARSKEFFIRGEAEQALQALRQRRG